MDWEVSVATKKKVTTILDNKYLSRSMLMIAVTLLGALVVSVAVNTANAHLGLVKSYGSGIGSPQPYEPPGPWVDGVLVPQFLVNQDNEWQQLKAGDLDVYDWALRKAHLDEYTANICVPAPDAPGGSGGCPAGQARIQQEIALSPVIAENGKFEVDMQNARFPTNILAFRQAIAYITDKEGHIANFLGGLGAPIYTPLSAPLTPAWAPAGFQASTALANHVYGAGLPIATRISIANQILENAGLRVGATGFREDCRSGACNGVAIAPVFRVRLDDPNRLNLGRTLRDIMAAAPPAGLGLRMVAGTNYLEQTRSQLFNAVFFQFDFNIYTGGWSLGRDPTSMADLYDSRFIRAGSTNYPNYADPVFDTAARALRSATSISTAVPASHAAVVEYNATIPVVDVWSTAAPLAYRNFHKDTDATLNGLRWEGFQLQFGVGWHNAFTWQNAHLVGAPLHDPNHPVFIKWGWKTDVLDSPNPIDSSFLWDAFAYGLSYDFLNNVVTDDLGFTGDLPWMASLPLVTSWTGAGCAATCSRLSYQLRSDLKFADGSQVTAQDVAFTIHLARDSPTSFLTPSYVTVKNVTVTGPLSFAVYVTNQAVWARHDIGFSPVVSMNLWCTARGFAVCNPAWSTGAAGWTSGFPDDKVNVLSSTNGAFLPGPPIGTNHGSGTFAYDSQNSFIGGPNGPVLYRTRSDYFTTLSGGWAKFHRAGNVNWYCTACTSGPSETGPIPAPDMVVNIVDLAIVAVHFGQSPGPSFGAFGPAAWDVSGPAGTADGTVNIFDLTRVALHFGQSYLGGTDTGGGAVGTLPGWIGESI